MHPVCIHEPKTGLHIATKLLLSRVRGGKKNDPNVSWNVTVLSEEISETSLN